MAYRKVSVDEMADAVMELMSDIRDVGADELKKAVKKGRQRHQGRHQRFGAGQNRPIRQIMAAVRDAGRFYKHTGYRLFPKPVYACPSA